MAEIKIFRPQKSKESTVETESKPFVFLNKLQEIRETTEEGIISDSSAMRNEEVTVVAGFDDERISREVNTFDRRLYDHSKRNYYLALIRAVALRNMLRK